MSLFYLVITLLCANKFNIAAKPAA